MNLRRLAVSLALAVSSTIAVRAAGPIVLDGPRVAKLDWNTRALVALDLDGDGLVDLAALNNDRARIDILYQRPAGTPAEPPPTGNGRWEPVLEDALFRKSTVTTGLSMYALAGGDLDGNGLIDLAYTSKRDTLTVVYQTEPGAWQERRMNDLSAPVQWLSTLQVADLDGNGRDDLVVLLDKELAIFTQEDDGGLGRSARYPLTDTGCYGLQLLDLDGDGRLDMTYLAARSTDALRIRFQTGDGEFGPERALEMRSPVEALRPLPAAPSGTVSFVGLEARTRIVEKLAVVSGAGGDTRPLLSSPRYFSTSTGDGPASSYAVGDLDGNGRLDVAAADPAGSRVLVYLQHAPGIFGQPRGYPSYSGLRSLTSGDLDGDGTMELIAVSGEEQVVGVSHLSSQGRLTYPEALPVTGKPLAAACGDLDGDDVVEIVYVREDGGQRQVAILSRRNPAADWRERIVTLDGLKTNPMAVRIIDADRNGRPDLAVFTLQSPVRILLQDDSGEFHDLAASSGYRAGLLDKVLPAALSTADLDGESVMLVAGRGVARGLSLTADGRLDVVDQFNSRDGDTVLAAAAGLDLDDDGRTEILLVEQGGRNVQVLRRDDEGVFRYDTSIATGPIDPVDIRVLDLDGDQRDDLMLFGKDRFWWLPGGPRDLGLERQPLFENDREEVFYSTLSVGDLDNDGVAEIVAVDAASSRRLDVLARDGDDWRSLMNFVVFESDPHYAGRQGAEDEPREMLIEDVTGDGRPDLVMLIHDRVLVYVQGS